MKWTLAPIKGRHRVHEILGLREVVFPGEQPEKEHFDYWVWEFDQARFGEAEIVAALDHDRLIGHYALLPQVYRIFGVRRTAGLAVDAMVHPDYRRQGMFRALQAYALGRSRRSFAIGYTIRKNVLPAELKGGYRIVRRAPVWVFPTRMEPVFARWFRPPAVARALGATADRWWAWVRPDRPHAPYRFQTVKELAPALHGFFDRQSARVGICLEKDDAYIRWRFDRIPGVRYDKTVVLPSGGGNAMGYMVSRTERLAGMETLALVDLETVDARPGLRVTMLRYAVSKARREGCDCVAALIVDDGRWTRPMQAFGFLKSPYRFLCIVHNRGGKDVAGAFRTADSVYLNWSDTDML